MRPYKQALEARVTGSISPAGWAAPFLTSHNRSCVCVTRVTCVTLPLHSLPHACYWRPAPKGKQWSQANLKSSRLCAHAGSGVSDMFEVAAQGLGKGHKALTGKVSIGEKGHERAAVGRHVLQLHARGARLGQGSAGQGRRCLLS